MVDAEVSACEVQRFLVRTKFGVQFVDNSELTTCHVTRPPTVTFDSLIKLTKIKTFFNESRQIS